MKSLYTLGITALLFIAEFIFIQISDFAITNALGIGLFFSLGIFSLVGYGAYDCYARRDHHPKQILTSALRQFMLGFFCLIAAFSLILGIYAVFGKVFFYVFNLQWALFAVVFAVNLVIAVTEEILIRGALQSVLLGIAKIGKFPFARSLAIGLQALVFLWLHVRSGWSNDPYYSSFVFCTAIVFGIFALQTRHRIWHRYTPSQFSSRYLLDG